MGGAAGPGAFGAAAPTLGGAAALGVLGATFVPGDFAAAAVSGDPLATAVPWAVWTANVFLHPGHVSCLPTASSLRAIP